jgi:hypothetical protein
MHITAELRKTFTQPITIPALTDLLSSLLRRGFEEDTTVDVIMGKPLIDDEPEAQLIITSVSIDSQSAELLSQTLTTLLFNVPFDLTSTGEAPLTPKEDLPVILGTIVNEHHVRQRKEQRVREERQARRDQEVDTEEWRYIRDKSGTIVDYINAD